MTKSEKAIQYFRDGFNCAQSVLVPFHTQFGMEEDHCLKISCAFGAGMGRQQHTCGAVTGALMVLGLQYGKGKRDDNTKKLHTYGKTVAFFEEFTRKNGSSTCLELLDGLRMSDPEDMKKFEELHRIKCAQYVRDAVEMVEKMIQDANM
jgi:C_GCAxxG_C_C family probable redox protein